MARSDSQHKGVLRYIKWLALGLVIGLGVNYRDEIKHEAEPLFKSTKQWAKGIESAKIETPPSSTTIPPILPNTPQRPSPISPITPTPNNVPQKPAEPTPFVELVLRPGESGHFFTNVLINGHSVKVMVDTGASYVSIPETMQTALELPMGKPVTFTTASDRYTSHETTIRHLVLGPILLQNITGDLNPRSPDGKILLGMSALKHLEMVHKNNTLTLRAPLTMAVMSNGEALNMADKTIEPLIIKRPVRDCIGKDKMIDQRALDCIKGN